MFFTAYMFFNWFNFYNILDKTEVNLNVADLAISFALKQQTILI